MYIKNIKRHSFNLSKYIIILVKQISWKYAALSLKAGDGSL